jgi:hypothetical protein
MLKQKNSLLDLDDKIPETARQFAEPTSAKGFVRSNYKTVQRQNDWSDLNHKIVKRQIICQI